jgi:hypothetical protein
MVGRIVILCIKPFHRESRVVDDLGDCFGALADSCSRCRERGSRFGLGRVGGCLDRLISTFVMRHPSIKVLALSFLLMIGVMLVAEGSGTHFNKNYIYFAMAFALGVELLNLRIHRRKLAIES